MFIKTQKDINVIWEVFSNNVIKAENRMNRGNKELVPQMTEGTMEFPEQL